MESDDGTGAIEPGPDASTPADGHTMGAEGDDPRARWRSIAEPIRPETWVAERDHDPLPGSLLAAEANREGEARRYLIERGGGIGA